MSDYEKRWGIKDMSKGTFMELHKDVLKVDHSYQREKTSAKRIAGIAKEWSWICLGVIVVCLRDGSYYIIDGQHRKFAADKRSDITTLPCIVFQSDDSSYEAKAFLGNNVRRGPVSSLDKFKTELHSHDENSIKVMDMISRTGYVPANGKGGTSTRHTVRCIKLLKTSMRRDEVAANLTWDLCVSLYDGNAVIDKVYGAIFELEHRLKQRGLSVFDKPHIEKLKAAGVDEIISKIHASKVFHGNGGYIVAAKGVLEILNYKKKVGRIEW